VPIWLELSKPEGRFSVYALLLPAWRGGQIGPKGDEEEGWKAGGVSNATSKFPLKVG
jgi:hypothetical protein